MAGFVDAHKGEVVGLLDLAVDAAVRGGDIRVTGVGVAGGGDERGEGLDADPVADVVGVAVVEDDVDARGDERGERGGRVWVAGVVARGGEGGADDGGGVGEVDDGADGALDGGAVEVVGVVVVGEGVRGEFARVVFVAAGVVVEDDLDFAEAKVVGV